MFTYEPGTFIVFSAGTEALDCLSGIFQNIMPASVQCDSFWKLHYHRSTFVQVDVKIPAELLGQMGFKLLRSFA